MSFERAHLGLSVTLLLVLSACRVPGPDHGAVQPLDVEAELEVFLDPLPAEAHGLSLQLTAIAALRTGTTASAALVVDVPMIDARSLGEARRIAHGRLPPGDYSGLIVELGEARLDEGTGSKALTVEPARRKISSPFSVGARRGVVRRLRLEARGLVTDGRALAAVFSPALDVSVLPGALGASADAGSHHVTLFDKPSRRVVAIVPTGREPSGLAIDTTARRIYVALAHDDAIEVIDLAAQEISHRVQLRPGDQPAEVALVRDVLLVTNAGSRSVAFVDPRGLVEIGRVDVGEDPRAIVPDPARRRAYVLSSASDHLSVIDPGNRAVLRTISTESRPSRAALSPDGRSLYVIHAGSPFMLVLSLPDLVVTGRVFVGLGASAIAVHPSTGRIYVAKSDDRSLEVYEPSALLSVETIVVPGTATLMAIDPTENLLALLVPEPQDGAHATGAVGSGRVLFLRLADARLAGSIEVGVEPRYFVLP